MAKVKITSDDSLSAMDEISRKLGPDAVIISTSRENGKITMVATNDVSEYPKADNKSRSAISTERDKSQNSHEFKKLLIEKETELSENSSKSNREDANLDSIINDLKASIDKLSRIKQQNKDVSSVNHNPLDSILASGVTQLACERSGISKMQGDLNFFLKELAKSFIAGHVKDIDNADMIFVTGLLHSGKTAFINKFKRMLEKENHDLVIKIFADVNSPSDFVKVGDWITSNSKSTKKHIALIEINDADTVDANFVRISKNFPNIRTCIINVSNVGCSHSFIVKNLRRPIVENEFLVLTKLDTCDLSLQEISAYIEMGIKCFMFTGNMEENYNDGLFPARVDHIQQYMTDIINGGSAYNG